MRSLLTASLVLTAATTAAQPRNLQFGYPDPQPGATTDVYFGEEVADPYRWLEDVEQKKIKLAAPQKLFSKYQEQGLLWLNTTLTISLFRSSQNHQQAHAAYWKPFVTALTPPTLPVSNDTQQLTVEGRFFQPGAQIVLRKGAEPEWQPQGQVATSTSIASPRMRQRTTSTSAADRIRASPSSTTRRRSGVTRVPV